MKKNMFFRVFVSVCTFKNNVQKEAAETQTSIRLASHLVRVANSRSGLHEFEFPAWRELVAMIKVERSLGSEAEFSDEKKS
jgi:hypothetical protein